jgi:hypothetical protein
MRVLLLISILMLGACTEQSVATLPTAWARTDGQPVNSTLLDIDSLDCKDEVQKESAETPQADSHALVTGFIGCMRERGYVQMKS